MPALQQIYRATAVLFAVLFVANGALAQVLHDEGDGSSWGANVIGLVATAAAAGGSLLLLLWWHPAKRCAERYVQLAAWTALLLAVAIFGP